mmetsp:Transcript_10573/g.23455  ORF Transcript_10573/g.23455 Transcript_10573/m.23455 type:complete len:134 (+) Transcript_10573:455-856(+)|eukprot:CAMPEP_0168837518 /NCGR_PEP_ID=MMETSP0727-20121128/5166_1 /TAXON_ID=265536 /ORGANISM="Amphiprora sp., Strain CCMP467" /LENGTH=133 /DNA_ID=CAMNT_0008890939 /DNA_START=374 /DNA_END=775 /DNA_ORIENTATION=+
MGVAVAWKSRGQKSVSLSSTESEFYACSETVREILFIVQVLESMGIKVKLPITVHVDNVGAIFLANNQTSGDRTKHIDTRYHFVREYIEDGTIKVVFVKTHLNDADLHTKNVAGELYEKHSRKLICTEVDMKN